MPDRWLARALLFLLPTNARRELFEPAGHDLQIVFATRRARLYSGAARAALRCWYVIKMLALFADCWRVVVTSVPDLTHTTDAPSTPVPRKPKERFAMVLYYIRHALRRLLREPAFTCAAGLTLALGVGANVAVFAVVEAVLLRPLPYADADRLVILNHRDQGTGRTKEFIAIGDYVDIAERQTIFDGFAGYGSFPVTVFGAEEPYRVAALQAAPGLLEMLKARPVVGRSLTPDDSRVGAGAVMMLGYELWKTRFGSDTSIVGRSVTVDTQPRLVVGIGPRGFRFPPTAVADVILPMTVPAQAPAERKSNWTFAVARLKSQGTAQDASRQLAVISHQMETEHPRSNQGSTYFVVPLRDALVGDTKPALVLLLSAVGVVLLIACANVANLLLARSMGRRREMAVRMALGAGRARLAGQLLTESLVLALVSSLAGVLVAQWGARALVGLIPKSVTIPGLMDVRINGTVLGFALGITVLATLAFSLVAALTVRSESAGAALVTGSRATMSVMARRATSGLVVAEIALATVLLVGAGLILRSFAGLLSVDPGFRYDHVLTLNIAVPADRYRDAGARDAFYARAFDALRAVPDVKDVGAAAVVPLTGNNWTVGFERPERPVQPGEHPPEVGWQVASGGYFKALQIPLVAGRLFDDRDRPGGGKVVIISEAIQKRFFPEGSAVGRQYKLGEQLMEIVGVVGDIRRTGLRDDPRADLYFPFESAAPTGTNLFVHTSSDPAHVLASVQGALRTVEPRTIFLETPRTLAEIASESVRVTQLVLWLLGIFAATALVLAAVGIYGVMSYVVRQRTREIGTRIALGATRHDILWLVMRQGAMIAALGTVGGIVAGLAAVRWLRSLLYGTSSWDPVTLGVAAAVLAATTLVACLVPARRAAAVDPARTLAEQ
ncbi:MAG TPA: ABC transporter permease [Gemmatimonadaceae bacterium]|nr:ABC transporter permease [Gemmatimonadaceae bacterium]